MRPVWQIVVIACASLLAIPAWGQKVGKEAPDLETENQFNAESGFSLKQYRGKIVVLEFWRTTDSESIDAIPLLNDIHSKLGKSGVVVIAHSPEDKERVDGVVKGKSIKYIVTQGRRAVETYEVSAYPEVFMLDPQGFVTWRGHPADDLENRIKDQIRKTPPAGSNVEALEARLKKAEQLQSSGRIGPAYTLVRHVADVAAKDSALATKAKSLKDTLEKEAQKQLDEAKQAASRAANEDVCRKLAELSVRFAGSEVGTQADEECAKLKGDRDAKTLIRKAIDNAKGEQRNDEAAELEESKRYTDALDVYREVTEKYADTEAASAATQSIERINGDPTIQKQIQQARAEEEATRWLDLADRFARVEMYDLARARYQMLLDDHPQSQAATKARERLAKLPTEPPTPTTQAAGGGEG